MPEHLTNHRAAHAQLVAKRPLDEPCAGTEITLHDGASQFLQRQFTQSLCTTVDFKVGHGQSIGNESGRSASLSYRKSMHGMPYYRPSRRVVVHGACTNAP